MYFDYSSHVQRNQYIRLKLMYNLNLCNTSMNCLGGCIDSLSTTPSSTLLSLFSNIQT